MRRRLKIASLTIGLLLIAFASLAFCALRTKPLPQPHLAGRVERGPLEHGGGARTWIAYGPVETQGHPGLVIALDSSMGTAEQARQVYGYDCDLLGEERCFMAGYRQGC